jgi:hypothetical protein
VPAFVAVIFAVGTTPPLESFTIPVMPAVTSCPFRSTGRVHRIEIRNTTDAVVLRNIENSFDETVVSFTINERVSKYKI